MRKIKFRAKRADETVPTWFFGYYYKHGNDHLMFGPDDISAVVHPSTLGQSVELSDCTGKEIFEGDVVRVDGADGDDLLGYIRWLTGGFAIQVIESGGRGHIIPLTYPGILGRLNVINNIHDEPAILQAQ